MPGDNTAVSTPPSARQSELLELAYRYALRHGLGDLSLRPLAAAVGSSPRVLLYLFGSKEGLVRALLARARQDELDLLADLRRRSAVNGAVELPDVAGQLWTWLAADEHRALITLWLEGYSRSLVDPSGPWAGFARATVEEWLTVLAEAQPIAERESQPGIARRTAALALLRGALLDLLATGDLQRVSAAVNLQVRQL
jgi:AcrR family transcriptional regulator